jgi:hypothetical protein
MIPDSPCRLSGGNFDLTGGQEIRRFWTHESPELLASCDDLQEWCRVECLRVGAHDG